MNETMIQQNEKTLPLEINYIPDIFRKKAELELNETPEKRIQGIQALKEMTKAEKDMKDIDFKDDFLQQFLRHSKYNYTKAFAQLRNFVHYRRCDALFGAIDDNTLKTDSGRCVTLLPKRCPDGCTVVLFELGKWNPDELSLDDYKRLAGMVYIQGLRNPMAQINGFKAIYDCTNVSIKLLRYVTPRNLSLVRYGGMNSFPNRIKELHLVSKSAPITVLWTVVKQFLSEKIRNRVYFHSNREGLLNHFPRSVLPTHYGGDLKDYYMEDCMREVNQQQGISTVAGQDNFF